MRDNVKRVVVACLGSRKICGFRFSRWTAVFIDIERPCFFVKATIVVICLILH